MISSNIRLIDKKSSVAQIIFQELIANKIFKLSNYHIYITAKADLYAAGGGVNQNLPHLDRIHFNTASTAKRIWNVKAEPHFTAVAPSQWRYVHTNAKQRLWLAEIGTPSLTAGRIFAGCLRVMADRVIKLKVSLGRQNVRTEYEGFAQQITLAPGVAQIVKLSKRFVQSHTALKLQVEVLDLPDGGAAVMTIDNLGINETVASIREWLGADNCTLARANELFRKGDYPAALGIYLWLSQQRPFPMYGDNAVRAAQKAGMPWVKAVDELAWVTSENL